MNTAMDAQYLPRGPAPMIRERELADNCLRQLLGAPELLQDRSGFLKYMDHITNEVLGISHDRLRREEQHAAKTTAAMHQTQIRQSITDDMRLASNTSLDKLRHLRE
eukprot:gene20604-15133_t